LEEEDITEQQKLVDEAEKKKLDKKTVKMIFNIMCEEDEVYEYDNLGITFAKFAEVYNAGIE
jgi:hypothetical protein